MPKTESKSVARPSRGKKWDDRELFLRRDQIKIAHSGVLTNSCITLGLLPVLWFVLSPLTRPTELFLWLGSLLVVTVVRLVISYHVYRFPPVTAKQIVLRQKQLIFPLAVLSILWATPVSVLIRGANHNDYFFVALFMCSVLLGALATLSVWRVVYIGFACTSLSVMAVAVLWRQETTLLIPVLLIMVQLVLLAASRLISQTYIQSILSRFENEQLTAEANAGKQIAERIARELGEEVEQRKKAQAQIELSERRFATLANTLEVGVIVYREKILYANPAAERMVGYSLEQLKSMYVWDLVTQGHRQQVRQMVQARLIGSDKKIAYESAMYHCSGKLIPIHVSSGLTQYDNDVAGIAAIIDISARIEAEQALQQEKHKIEITLSSVGDGVISVDGRGLVSYLNPVAAQLIGVDAAAVIGKPVQSLLILADQSTNSIIPLTDKDLTASHLTDQFDGQDLVLERADRSQVPISISVTALQDNQSTSQGLVFVIRDETEVRSLTQLMIYQASHDPLTGLINRREFEDRLNELLQSGCAEKTEHMLFYMDLDQFKVINDTCGHASGDQLLKTLAGLLQSVVRETDTLARLGGDEFAVILNDCPLSDAKKIAAKIIQTVKDYRFSWEGRLFEVGISIGMVSIGKDTHLQDLLSAADTACYIAKDQGRNSVQLYQENDAAITQRRGQMNWLYRLQRALQEDRFGLYIQEIRPSDGLDDGCFRGELLLRKVSHQGEPISPNQFLPAAERYQLMPEIDRWVMKAAIEAITELVSVYKGQLLFGINVSGQSLADPSFLKDVMRLISRSSVMFHQICFEVTETAAITNMDHALKFLRRVRAEGSKISLDDFGSGVSSFGYLKHFPVDSLKIDGRFVREMLNSPEDRALVTSMCQVGKVMGIKTVAEHAEDEQTCQALRHVGVDFIQGYGIHRPEPFQQWSQQRILAPFIDEQSAQERRG